MTGSMNGSVPGVKHSCSTVLWKLEKKEFNFSFFLQQNIFFWKGLIFINYNLHPNIYINNNHIFLMLNFASEFFDLLTLKVNYSNWRWFMNYERYPHQNGNEQIFDLSAEIWVFCGVLSAKSL